MTYLALGRGTIVDANDSPAMQEVTIRDQYGDKASNVEHWQPYGFSAVPLPPKDGKEAEVLVAYLGGSADHPVVVGTADRRHRPKNLKPGEVAFHDDQGQTIKLGRDGIEISGGGGNRPLTITVGGVSMKLSSDGLDVTGGYVKHDGKRIDAQHRHGGVQSGGSQTNTPVAILAAFVAGDLVVRLLGLIAGLWA